MKLPHKKLSALARLVAKRRSLGMIAIIIPCILSSALQAQNPEDDAFAFLETLIVPIENTTDQYLSRNNVWVDEKIAEEKDENGVVIATYPYELVRAYLYSNALSAIVLTHRGVTENNQAYLDKAAGIFKTFGQFQYDSSSSVLDENGNPIDLSHVYGAFPNILISEHYHVQNNDVLVPPYCTETPFQAIFHGNNGWYLMALGYYTLQTGDRQFVGQLEALADYFSSSNAQDQTSGSPTEGAIYFGWGLGDDDVSVQKSFISTEHQSEVYSGLLYAAEVIKDEVGGVTKQQHYMDCANKLLNFVMNKLYNPNNVASRRNPSGVPHTVFHSGLDGVGGLIPNAPASLDAQTWLYLAFSRPLMGIQDLSGTLDYAWNNMYGKDPTTPALILENFEGGVDDPGKGGPMLAGESYVCGATSFVGSGETYCVQPWPLDLGRWAKQYINYGSSWGCIEEKVFDASIDVSAHDTLEFSFLSDGDDQTRTIQIQLSFENIVDGSAVNTWNWVTPVELADGYAEWTTASISLTASNFVRSSTYVTGNDFDLTRLKGVSILILNNGATSSEAPVYVDDVCLTGGGSIVPIEQLQITEGLDGIDQVLGYSQAANKNVKGMLWYERDRGIWITGSAQMAIAYDHAYSLSLDVADLDRSVAVFDDMTAMEWPADTYTANTLSLSFPKGGFATFSDNYHSRTAVMEVGVAEKIPGVEPTAWRYFDWVEFNPYTIDFDTALAAPTNFIAAANGAVVSMTWDTVPEALSYRIMRNGEVIGHVSNLDNTGSAFVDSSAEADPAATYSVVGRDMGGQLGLVASSNTFYVNPTKVIASNSGGKNFYGVDVSMSGNIAVVGAYGDDDLGEDSGSAYLVNTTTGVETAMLLANDGAAYDYFGGSVGIDGNVVIVGADGDDDNGLESGSAYLFNASTGAQTAKLLASDGAADDQFGWSVDVDGNVAIVGAPAFDTSLSNGAAYLFDATTGLQLHKLVPNDIVDLLDYGRAVAIDGNLAIVSSSSEHSSGWKVGSVYVFDVTTGNQLYKLTSGIINNNGIFGNDISIDGTVAMIGAPRENVSANNSGAAYLFDLTTGTQLFKVVPDPGHKGDLYGRSVSVQGSYMMVGSATDDINGYNSGSVYIYNVSTGDLAYQMWPNDGESKDQFGRSISISGNKVVVGAWKDKNSNGRKSGSAYIFDLP